MLAVFFLLYIRFISPLTLQTWMSFAHGLNWDPSPIFPRVILCDFTASYKCCRYLSVSRSYLFLVVDRSARFHIYRSIFFIVCIFRFEVWLISEIILCNVLLWWIWSMRSYTCSFGSGLFSLDFAPWLIFYITWLLCAFLVVVRAWCCGMSAEMSWR